MRVLYIILLTVAHGLYQGFRDVLQAVEAGMNYHIGVQWSAGDHRQLGDVDKVTDADGDHADAVHATDRRLDWCLLVVDVRVAVADEDGNVRHGRAVAVALLERPAVDQPQRLRRVRPITAERHAPNRFHHVLLHLSEFVHVETDESVVAPVDEPDARPLHPNVQFVDRGDDHLFNLLKSFAGDASRTIQDEYQIHQPAAVCRVHKSQWLIIHYDHQFRCY